ncbi:MAG: helicase-related protein, partial [Candidatus Binatia bacterium]
SRFHYRAYNTGEEGEERLAAVDVEDSQEILRANVRHLARQGEQVLIFLKGKRETVQCALALAETLMLPPAQDALAGLEALEETTLKAQLRTALTGGVAFHHADLTSEERALVEAHYRQGGVRVIACTTTLAFGVNLPASTVFLEGVKWDTDRRTGAALEVPLSWAEYENISGRAGRLGFYEQFGRSVLIATNQFQADLLWRSYVMGEQEQFTPAPGQEGLVDRVLNLIASQTCINTEELQAFLRLTYLGFQQRNQTVASLPTFTTEVESILATLVRMQLVSVGEDGRLEASTLGEVAARKGIRAATAVKLARFFEAAQGREVPELELFYLLGLTEDGKKMYVPLSTAEHRNRTYQDMAQDMASEWKRQGSYAPGEELNRLLTARMLPTAQEARAAKLAFLLSRWIGGDALADLESRFQCYAGTINTVVDTVSWLVDAAAEIAQVMSWTPATLISELAERVRLGIDLFSEGQVQAGENPPALHASPFDKGGFRGISPSLDTEAPQPSAATKNTSPNA